MKPFNLMPGRRLRRAHIRRHAVTWGVGLAFYALATCVITAITVPSASTSGRMERELTRVSEAITGTQEEIAQIQQELDQDSEKLRLFKRISAGVSWSQLLREVARARVEGVTFMEWTLVGPPITESTPELERYTMTITGVVKEYQNATAFAVALERLGLFQTVNTKNIGKENPNSEDQISFEVSAQLLPIRRDVQEPTRTKEPRGDATPRTEGPPSLTPEPTENVFPAEGI